MVLNPNKHQNVLRLKLSPMILFLPLNNSFDILGISLNGSNPSETSCTHTEPVPTSLLSMINLKGFS